MAVQTRPDCRQGGRGVGGVKRVGTRVILMREWEGGTLEEELR